MVSDPHFSSLLDCRCLSSTVVITKTTATSPWGARVFNASCWLSLVYLVSSFQFFLVRLSPFCSSMSLHVWFIYEMLTFLSPCLVSDLLGLIPLPDPKNPKMIIFSHQNGSTQRSTDSKPSQNILCSVFLQMNSPGRKIIFFVSFCVKIISVLKNVNRWREHLLMVSVNSLLPSVENVNTLQADIMFLFQFERRSGCTGGAKPKTELTSEQKPLQWQQDNQK